MEAKDEIKVYKQKLETYNEKEEEEDQIEKNNFFEVAIDNDEIFKVNHFNCIVNSTSWMDMDSFL